MNNDLSEFPSWNTIVRHKPKVPFINYAYIPYEETYLIDWLNADDNMMIAVPSEI